MSAKTRDINTRVRSNARGKAKCFHLHPLPDGAMLPKLGTKEGAALGATAAPPTQGLRARL